MTLLFLSMAGRMNQPEDVRVLHLFFASLKEQVLPFFTVKVLLLNTSTTSDQTQALVDSYGLSDVVDVRRLTEMELPSEAIDEFNVWEKTNPIPFHLATGWLMNLMFDYAKRFDFFGADWVFHTDSDIEFMESFPSTLNQISGLTSIHPKMFISIAGDAGEESLYCCDGMDGEPPAKIRLDAPSRKNMYTDEPPFLVWRKKIEKPPAMSKLPFNYTARYLKVTNFFVAMSRAAAHSVIFDWAITSTSIPATPSGIVEGGCLGSIEVNADRGNLVLYDLQYGKYDILHIQLPLEWKTPIMVKHYASGWLRQMQEYGGWRKGYQVLAEKYPQYKSIWSSIFEYDDTAINLEHIQAINRTHLPA